MSESIQFVASAALLCATSAIIIYLRYRDQVSRDTNRLTYCLNFPRDLTIQQVTAFVRVLGRMRSSRGWLFGRDSVVFEGIGLPGRIEHRLRLPRYEADVLLRQLRAVVPGLRATLLEAPALPRATWLRRIGLTTILRPLRTGVAETFAVGLLNTLQPVFPDETLVYQLVVFPVRVPTSRASVRSDSQLLPPWLHRLVQLVRAAPPAITDIQDLAAFRAKTAEPWFGIHGAVGAVAPGRTGAHLLVGRVMANLHLLDQEGASLVPRWLPQRVADWLTRGATSRPLTSPIYGNALETATMLAWPLGGPTVPGLALSGSRLFPPSVEVPSTGRLLGTAAYDGLQRPVAVPPAGALMHQLVTGATGTGKSTLLLNQITQDMEAGRAVIVIDPGGDLARDVVDRVPVHRLHDLIYFDAASDHPVGLNPLDCPLQDAELVADQVLELLHDQSEGWGPRLQEILKNALVLLAATPGGTLVDVPAVLTNRRFRGSLVERLDSGFAPTVGAFFARFDQWADGEREQAVSAVLNKVSPLTDRRQLRAIVGQAKPSWSVQDVIDGRKILVVALPSGQVGAPAADLLGGLIIHMVWNAALKRTAIVREQREQAALYIDEVARFLRSGANLADMLARARGHALGLVAALQHLAQTPTSLRKALLSEARTKVAFQAGPDDAATLAHTFGTPVEPQDLLSLDAHTALASVVTGSKVTPAVTITTSPPPEPTGYGEAARAASQATYGRAPADVEREIHDRQAAAVTPRRPLWVRPRS
ncbi:type IV secretion system DNA-binding domain-containing protein [Streptomyces sp. So13.3]|uniref:type IV secretory system conjugative DNA transfer family protein n=1 Tax=Streptomyces sp. So13.3 TaxID=2136173 RepID=UPI00110654F3|nr:type IV secretion system DNA-binding domain-containing protein [Streptomyces sp. So13.3]QNA75365.1 type IV secretion system DNA-binding domain-containing protein [Streptomyces sp. So13.3]